MAQSALDDLKLGCVLVIREAEASALPLENTDVQAAITGPVASVRVMQRFGNPFRTPITLEYLFPLPETAAIVDYEIAIGTRTIRAELKEREAARKSYREAVANDQRASLLEQRQPNLFAVEIGNVQPGEAILTTIHYEQRVPYRDDRYEFVFPMGITPKYHTPGTPAETVQGTTAPVTRDDRSVGPVQIRLSLDAGVPVGDPVSTTHTIQVTRSDDRRLALTFGEDRVIPNKDFVLHYAVASDQVRAAAWISPGASSDQAEYALITALPPRLDINVAPPPREFIFVLDRSGSMSGGPLDQAKNALRACLRALNERDTFLIEVFDDRRDWFDKTAKPVTQANVEAADRWLDGISSRGGTEILRAVTEALTIPADAARQRYVVFLTDGAVSDDERTIKEVSGKRGTARIFTFGIGPSVNRSLLNKMAQLGRGTAEFMTVQQDIEATITRFQDRVSYPALLDVTVTWQDAESWDSYPAVLPDLYVGQPLELAARFKRTGGSAAVRITGKRDGQPVTLDVPLPASSGDSHVLDSRTVRRVWAQARVEALTDTVYSGGDQERVRQQIISLALEHRLLTPYTSFVAVDSEKTTGGEAKEVTIAVPLPEGLDLDSFFDADPAGGLAFMMAAPPTLSASGPVFGEAPDSDDSDQKPGRGKRGLARLFGKRQAEELEDEFTSGFAPDPLPAKMMKGGSRTPPAAAPKPELPRAERIKLLARTQNVDGSWGSGADQVEMTAAALLAFVRDGHTLRQGSYRQQVRKAALWLKAHTGQVSGMTAYLAYRALFELDQADGLSDADRMATDDLKPSVTVPDAAPTTIRSLDDLRTAALIHGEVKAGEVKGVSEALLDAWKAVGKPRRA